jgi:membrane associated rhomboid family serine protease
VLAFGLGHANVPSAGASGAIFGLFSALIMVLRRLKLSIASVLPVLLVNLVITFSLNQYISWQAHIGGLITGAVVGAGFAFAPQKHRTALQVATIAGTLVLLGVGFAVGLADIPAVVYG